MLKIRRKLSNCVIMQNTKTNRKVGLNCMKKILHFFFFFKKKKRLRIKICRIGLQFKLLVDIRFTTKGMILAGAVTSHEKRKHNQ